MRVFAANMVRTHFPVNAVKLVLALALLVSVGCRSRSERDLVERELRLHEDQIYALEDYLTEYQEIVRRSRCENMELKRELERLSNSETTTSPRSPALPRDPLDDSWSPDRPQTRELLDRPRSQGPPDPFQDDDPTIEVIEPEIELGPPVPVTPPVEPTPEQATKSSRQTERGVPDIVPAQVLSDARPLTAIAPPATSLLTPHPSPLAEIAPSPTAVQAELVMLEGQSSPSLHVAVEPRTGDGQPLDYVGPLEVMLLDPLAGEMAPALARWEFTPTEVGEAWRDPESREMLDVLAELPPELPLDCPLELWVRLHPGTGGKVLASTVLAPREVASETLSVSETIGDIVDENISPAGHWVPSESTIVPKTASAAGSVGGRWLPRAK